MQAENSNSAAVCSHEEPYCSDCLDSSCPELNAISDAFLENLISLKKTPFLIEEQDSAKRINSPETCCERVQQKIISYNRKEKSLE